VKLITEVIGARLRPKGARAALLQVAGFTLVAWGAAMLLPAAGVIVAGISLVVLAGLQE